MADFERLLREHKDAVYRQMVRACGSRDDAEDVLAEAVLNAYRAMSQSSEPENFRAWLATIGRRLCGRLRAKEALAPVLALGDRDFRAMDPEIPDEAFEGNVLAVLESLPADYRQVITLRDLEGLSGDETAKRLGLSLPAMKSRLLRARAELRQRLDACVGCQP